MRALAKEYKPKSYKPKVYRPKQYKPKRVKKYHKGEVMIKELTVLADTLDSKGFFKEANELDCIIKFAFPIPMSKEELKQKEDEVRVRLRNQFRSEEDIENILDIIFPQRTDVQSSLKFGQEAQEGQRRIFQEEEGTDSGLETEQDPGRYDAGRIPPFEKVKEKAQHGPTIVSPGKDPHVYRDPRVVEEADGTLRCKDCGSVIPIEEDQLGCSVCEEEKNLGFLKSPDGTLHPPRLKNPPRIYDRYREELPEDVEMQTGFIREKQEQRVNKDLYPQSGGEPY